jgi:hypothetical protein
MDMDKYTLLYKLTFVHKLACLIYCLHIVSTRTYENTHLLTNILYLVGTCKSTYTYSSFIKYVFLLDTLLKQLILLFQALKICLVNFV